MALENVVLGCDVGEASSACTSPLLPFVSAKCPPLQDMHTAHVRQVVLWDRAARHAQSGRLAAARHARPNGFPDERLSPDPESAHPRRARAPGVRVDPSIAWRSSPQWLMTTRVLAETPGPFRRR